MHDHGEGEGCGYGDGSGSGSDSQASWTDPITIIIQAAEMNRMALWDAATARYAAAGDTVIIDGVTVTEGAAGRGIYRLVGFGAFLTQFDGCVRNHPLPQDWDIGRYEYPEGGPAQRIERATYDGANFVSVPAVEVVNTGMSLTVAGGGWLDMTTKSTARALVNGVTGAGTVTFFCGNMTQKIYSCQYVSEDAWAYECDFNGTDLGGHVNDSFTLTAVFSGSTTPNPYRAPCQGQAGVRIQT